MTDKQSMYAAQYLRSFMMPDEYEQHLQGIIKRGGTSGRRPYVGNDYALVLDCETTTDPRQALRIGSFAVHGCNRDMHIIAERAGRLDDTRDALVSRGFYYDPKEVTPTEVDAITQYARRHKMSIFTRNEFVVELYEWIYKYRGMCIGHNLPFDLSRLATSWNNAAGDFYGGFWFQLCTCKHGDKCIEHPPIRIKSFGNKKAMFKFRIPSIVDAEGQPVKKGKGRPYEGRFIDTCTLGRALLGPGGSSLEEMGRRFKAKVLKKEWPGEHGCTITEEYLDYLVNDVEATWSLYQAERAVYEKHKLPTPAWEIYSEASIGKAYLEALGIPRFMVKHHDFPRDVLGQFMSAYYGGRSEVRVRLQPAEVAYYDFKSQYPTVNAVMNLQALHLAERLEVRHCADEVRAFMNGLTLDMLREKATWLNLVCVVKVIAKGDILPVRTTYGKQSPVANIGINYVTCARPTPYTLADVIASWLLTRKVPEIADAIEIVPQGQVLTNKLDFFGDERFPIDLAQHDLFTRVIDLRSEFKKQCDDYKRGSDEHAPLDGMQKGLKLMAASTSYGVAAEVIVEEREYEREAILYAYETKRMRHKTMEKPGKYFNGIIAPLIPAAGRLLLAIAERLARDRGLDYVLCDTDSMLFERPAGMDRETFRSHVQDITNWFQPLLPYASGRLFEMESQNWGLADGKPVDGQWEPL